MLRIEVPMRRPGFKESRAGWIPIAWDCVPFGEIVESSQYGLSCSASDAGSVPILGMPNVRGGEISDVNLGHVEISDQEFEKYRILEGDLLFNRTNSAALVGKSAVAKTNLAVVYASYLVRFRIKKEKALPRYVGHFFSSSSAAERLSALATPGVSQYNINPTRLQKHLWIALPPIDEQRRILSILEKLDAAREGVGRLIETKHGLRKGLAHQLLSGQRRFPCYSRVHDTRSTRYGLYPADWEYPCVGQVAKEVSERSRSKNRYTVLSCSKHQGLVDSLEYFGKRIFSSDTSNYKVVRRGQYAYATNHLEEGSIGLLTTHDAGLISPIYTVFETDARKVYAPFLFRLFKTELYRHIFEVNTSSSVDRRGSLRWTQFATIHVPLPTLGEQRRIVEVLDTVDREIDLLTRQADALTRQKKAVMQKLLTGQIRVKV